MEDEADEDLHLLPRETEKRMESGLALVNRNSPCPIEFLHVMQQLAHSLAKTRVGSGGDCDTRVGKGGRSFTFPCAATTLRVDATDTCPCRKHDETACRASESLRQSPYGKQLGLSFLHSPSLECPALPPYSQTQSKRSSRYSQLILFSLSDSPLRASNVD